MRRKQFNLTTSISAKSKGNVDIKKTSTEQS